MHNITLKESRVNQKCVCVLGATCILSYVIKELVELTY